ncbi:MAG: thiamine diphosphokinase [Desulfovibrio sp.]|nr:MAG: thiamine diphosphokinase [Desulfovibrio sp.]
MGKRAVVFANGDVRDPRLQQRWLKQGDLLICADGGARHCLAMGLAPLLVVGDFDSISPEQAEECAALGTTLERHPVDKDNTDLELALARAVDMGADQVLVLGAWGDEPDHTLGNLLVLAGSEYSVPMAIAQDNCLIRVLRDHEELVIKGPLDGMVSVLALSRRVSGITYAGLKYPLMDAVLDRGSGRALRNRIVENPACIRIGKGLLWTMHEVFEP